MNAMYFTHLSTEVYFSCFAKTHYIFITLIISCYRICYEYNTNQCELLYTHCVNFCSESMYLYLFFLDNLQIFFLFPYIFKVIPKILEGFLQEAFISMTGFLIQFFIFDSPGITGCFWVVFKGYNHY